MIDNSADNDYYRIEVTALQRNMKIKLTELPQDYDLYLYSDRGGSIKSSLSGGPPGRPRPEM